MVRECDTEMVNSWLARSGQRPLSIYIDISLCSAKVSKSAAMRHHLIPAILRHAQRWRILRLEVPYSILQSFTGLHTTFPSLQTIILNSLDYVPEDLAPTTFADAPKLHDAHIGFNLSSSKFRIPWAQLTKYCTEDSTIFECIDVLCAAVNLVECSLSPWREPIRGFPTLHAQPSRLEVMRLLVQLQR